MICKRCGAELVENTIVCNKCGEKMKAVAPPPIKSDVVAPKNAETSNCVKPQQKKKRKKIKLIIMAIVIGLILVVSVVVGVVLMESRYISANKMKETNPVEAYQIFEGISWYKDADDKCEEQKSIILNAAKNEIAKGNFSLAKSYLEFLGDYPGVDEALDALALAEKEDTYQQAVTYFKAGLYYSAKSKFQKVLGYKDTDLYLDKFAYKLGSYYSSVTIYQTFTQMSFKAPDVLIMSEDGIINTYLYAIVESDEEYQCSRGDYEVWIIGEVINKENIYYDYPKKIIGISNPKFNEDGFVVEFESNGIKFLESELS